MISAQVAEHLGGRRSGENRWMALCPGHDDRNASLSIGTGADGRVLLNCHAGCSLSSVLTKAGLKNRDLFAEAPPAPQHLAAIRREREVEVARRRRARKTEQRMLKELQSLSAVVNDLGGKLMCNPEDDGLAWLFDSACHELHEEEASAEERGIVAYQVGRWIEAPPLVHGYNPMEDIAHAFGWNGRAGRSAR